MFHLVLRGGVAHRTPRARSGARWRLPGEGLGFDDPREPEPEKVSFRHSQVEIFFTFLCVEVISAENDEHNCFIFQFLIPEFLEASHSMTSSVFSSAKAHLISRS